MPETPAAKKKPDLTSAEIESKLVSLGIHPTAQRIAICQYILCEANHPTAEAVKAWVDQHFPKVSLATVYNTLGRLVAAGLLREFRLPHSESVIYDDNTTHHFHFLDQKTGELYDLPAEAIVISSKLKRGFKVESVDVFVQGTIS